MTNTLLFTVCVIGHLGTLLAATPEVQLPNGLIRGRQSKTFNGTKYFAFEKIPYAAPPVGDLRFKAPVPPSNWDEPLEMSVLDVSCYQVGLDDDYESEDCLYLKVITPQLPTEEVNVSLAVMVNIYGGGFVQGSAMDTYSDRIIDEGVILVAMNYRVGIFGFISTGDEVIPGNNGLKDQQLALQWVHNNIHLFGGDPNNVIIVGQGAGAASCAYQLLNLANEGLFQGAILESGTALSPWAFQRRARQIAFETAALLNDTFKTNQNSNELLEYLQSVDAKVIDDASAQYSNISETLQYKQIRTGFFWAPVIEEKNSDAFITHKMFGLIKAGNVVQVPIFIGMTSEEALFYSQDQEALKEELAEYDANLGWLVPDDMGITDEAARTEMGSKIRDIYTNGETFASNLANGVRFYSDTSFTRSIIKFAELFSNHSMTYFYQFSYEGDFNNYSVQYDGAEHVGHGQEAAYIFCLDTECDLSNNTATDQIISTRMARLWANFAKYQNPTPDLDEVLQEVIWFEVNTNYDHTYYVDINFSLLIQDRPKRNTYDKWLNLYNSLGTDDFDTY